MVGPRVPSSMPSWKQLLDEADGGRVAGAGWLLVCRRADGGRQVVRVADDPLGDGIVRVGQRAGDLRPVLPAQHAWIVASWTCVGAIVRARVLPGDIHEGVAIVAECREDLLLLTRERLELVCIAVFVLDRHEAEVRAGVAAAIEGEGGDVAVVDGRAHIVQVREGAKAAERVDQTPASGRAIGAKLATDVEHLGPAMRAESRAGDGAIRIGKVAGANRRDDG